MNHKRRFAAWVLASLLVAPAVQASDIVDFRALAGLPRAGLVGGQAIAWRNVGIAAETQWLDAEVTAATCLPMISAWVTPSDRPGSTCGASIDPFANADLGHQFAVTIKLPRWSDYAPLVDLALRSWRAPSQALAPGERSNGSIAELVLTQPLGAVDTFVGFATPVALGSAGGHGRSTFAGVTWYAGQGTRLELVADRGEEVASARIDRKLTLRIVHATPARNARVAAWTTRALDDRGDAWRVGGGLEVTF